MNELQALVSAILRSRRIKNKLVVLCEGDRLPIEAGRAPSPQMYRRLDSLPDANFYKNCVPTSWHGNRLPSFFNCGDRGHVLHTFAALLAAHHANPSESYLSPEKLYALVDLDLQAGRMPADYPWLTTEDVHEDLYHDGTLKADVDERHRIWVTALIHKEAFFVLPGVEAVWEGGGTSPFFRNAPLDLRALHLAVADYVDGDADLARHLHVVERRLRRFAAGLHLQCSCGADLASSWRGLVERASNDEYRGLVKTLFAVAKVKPIWSEIVPNPEHDPTFRAETFREQLALKVAQSIAKLEPTAHPIASFFAWLEPRR